jgi:hypothetical protein
VEHAVLATQDVGLTTWGWGVQGLSFTALLRGRADLGGTLAWPRSDDRFDAILAYAELNRGDFRARVGRQRTASSLGFNGYDGASLVFGGIRNLDLEAYGGRSLMRGTSLPRSSALRASRSSPWTRSARCCSVAPSAMSPSGGRAWGCATSTRSGATAAACLRAGVGGVRTSQFLPLMLEATVDYDVGFGRIGKAHATVRRRRSTT